MGVQLCITVPFGSVVRLSAIFTRPPTEAEILAGTAADENDWQLDDPDTVYVKVKDPTGNVDQYDYLGSPSGELVRDDVGEYHLDFVANVSGRWFYQWTGTGAVAATNEDRFTVAPTEF